MVLSLTYTFDPFLFQLGELTMRILIPVDGSQHSVSAVQFVASHSTTVGGSPEIELLNVQAPIPARAARLVGQAACTSYYEDEANKVLRPALRTLNKAGLAPRARYEVGHAAEVIAAATEKKRGQKAASVDLLVMGSHGRGAMMRLLMGSITTGVLARTTTPVLLLRGTAHPVRNTLKVAIAIDGSAYGLAAVRYVIKHRDLFGAERAQIELVHAVPDFLGAYMPDMSGVALPAFTPREIEAMQHQAFESAMAPVRKLCAQAKLGVTEVRLVGAAGDALSAYARKKKIDVLVMGSHGHGAFSQAVLGSVTTRVAAQCATPLLVIRKT